MADEKTSSTSLAFDGWGVAGLQPWLNGIYAYHGEFLEFLAERFAKDSRMMRQLGDCHTWADALQLQTGWLQDALKDWTAEPTKLMSKQPGLRPS